MIKLHHQQRHCSTRFRNRKSCGRGKRKRTILIINLKHCPKSHSETMIYLWRKSQHSSNKQLLYEDLKKSSCWKKMKLKVHKILHTNVASERSQRLRKKTRCRSSCPKVTLLPNQDICLSHQNLNLQHQRFLLSLLSLPSQSQSQNLKDHGKQIQNLNGTNLLHRMEIHTTFGTSIYHGLRAIWIGNQSTPDEILNSLLHQRGVRSETGDEINNIDEE